MVKVTISELRNQLSAYLKKVRAGEKVVILDRQTPVARLVRLEVEAHPDDRLMRLERDGLVSRGAQPVPMELIKSAPPASTESVLEALLEERRQAR
jgi:prevent-host-death family protein